MSRLSTLQSLEVRLLLGPCVNMKCFVHWTVLFSIQSNLQKRFLLFIMTTSQTQIKLFPFSHFLMSFLLDNSISSIDWPLKLVLTFRCDNLNYTQINPHMNIHSPTSSNLTDYSSYIFIGPIWLYYLHILQKIDM